MTIISASVTASIIAQETEVEQDDNSLTLQLPVVEIFPVNDFETELENVTQNCVSKKKTVCTIDGAMRLEDNGIEYASGAFSIVSTCKGSGASASCTLKSSASGFVATTSGIPVHDFGFFLSSDGNFDPGDVPLLTGSTSLFSQGGKKKKLKGAATLLSGTTVSGMQVLLVDDPLNVVQETDESNNFASSGSLP